jgi:hypothetical protein
VSGSGSGFDQACRSSMAVASTYRSSNGR